MVKRIRFTAEAFEKYLDGLNNKFDTSILWITLQGKSEYGAVKSERIYQTSTAFKAAMMARQLGLNEERASFYAKCLGAAFPAFGKEGKKRLEEYAIAYDLPFDEKETMSSVIEESFSQGGKFVVEGLREILLELFDESKDSDIQEVELAKLYHERMEILKIIDRKSKAEFEETERLLDEEIGKSINGIGIVRCKRRLMEYRKSMPKESGGMTMEESESYYKRIDQYREYSGDECLINFILYDKNLA